ncbi:hypothetical protein ACFL3T_04385 [Patescibacteria group bacterium]
MAYPDVQNEEGGFERPKEDWFACIVAADAEELNELPYGKENIALGNLGMATTKILRSEVDVEESFLRVMEAFFYKNSPFAVIDWVDEEGLKERDRLLEEGIARLRAKFADIAAKVRRDH